MSRNVRESRGNLLQHLRHKIAVLRDLWRGSLLDAQWAMVHALAPRRFVHARGLHFSLQCDNRIMHFRWRSYNYKEPETLDWIDQWLCDGDTLFDIGANVGVYTIYAALRQPGIRVVAFEPEYSNLHLLRDNVMHNGLCDRVQIYSVALGNRSGLSHLHIQDMTPGAALHTESSQRLTHTLTERPVIWQEGIAIVTLDDFCASLDIQPNALKIDVDGTEPHILEGAQRVLHSPTLRTVIIENPKDPHAHTVCKQLLQEAGLQCLRQDSSDTLTNDIWLRPPSSVKLYV